MSEDQYVAEVVFQLPLKYREVLLLFYYEEESIADIAEILKININTVKTRLHRGKKILKQQLEEDLHWMSLEDN